MLKLYFGGKFVVFCIPRACTWNMPTLSIRHFFLIFVSQITYCIICENESLVEYIAKSSFCWQDELYVASLEGIFTIIIWNFLCAPLIVSVKNYSEEKNKQKVWSLKSHCEHSLHFMANFYLLRLELFNINLWVLYRKGLWRQFY